MPKGSSVSRSHRCPNLVAGGPHYLSNTVSESRIKNKFTWMNILEVKFEWMNEQMNSNQWINSYQITLQHTERGWSSNPLISMFIHTERRYVQLASPQNSLWKCKEQSSLISEGLSFPKARWRSHAKGCMEACSGPHLAPGRGLDTPALEFEQE